MNRLLATAFILVGLSFQVKGQEYLPFCGPNLVTNANFSFPALGLPNNAYSQIDPTQWLYKSNGRAYDAQVVGLFKSAALGQSVLLRQAANQIEQDALYQKLGFLLLEGEYVQLSATAIKPISGAIASPVLVLYAVHPSTGILITFGSLTLPPNFGPSGKFDMLLNRVVPPEYHGHTLAVGVGTAASASTASAAGFGAILFDNIFVQAGPLCTGGATCTPEFVCICPAGFTGVNCSVDIDECAEGLDNCDINASCNNTIGNFTCDCFSGYEPGGDGICVDIDECALEIDDCGMLNCTNTEGSFVCGCAPGYMEVETTCQDIDECALNTDNCPAEATCSNTQGSFTCNCPSGYTYTGGVCQDINECAQDTDECDTYATCTNTAGSYTCACNPGFSGDGFTCVSLTIGAQSISASKTCNPFGHAYQFDDFLGYAYANIPAFSLSVGDYISFDLTAQNLLLNPCYSIALASGTNLDASFTTVSSEVTATSRGNAVLGDFETKFIVETPFVFSGGNLVIRLSNPCGLFAVDFVCNEVLQTASSTDPSGFFVARFNRDGGSTSSFTTLIAPVRFEFNS